MPNFFSDDPNSGNDLEDLMNKAPGAILTGLRLGYLFGLPFLVAGKVIEAIGSSRPTHQTQTGPFPPPPDSEPRYTYTPPPKPPPTAPKSDPLERHRLTLGVQKDASAEAIRSRYRFLAKAFHPDRFTDAESKKTAEEDFKRIKDAHDALMTAAKFLMPPIPPTPSKAKPSAQQAKPTQHPTPPVRQEDKPSPAPTQPAKMQADVKPPEPRRKTKYF